jgi:hypothetical protein
MGIRKLGLLLKLLSAQQSLTPVSHTLLVWKSTDGLLGICKLSENPWVTQEIIGIDVDHQPYQ